MHVIEQACNFGIADIGSVKEADKVEQTKLDGSQ